MVSPTYAPSEKMLQPIPEDDHAMFRSLPAHQQPDWPDRCALEAAREALRHSPGLVPAREIAELRSLLADVARGRLQVVQAGDCAEDPAECSLDHVSRKVGLLELLASVVSGRSGRPVVTVGRIAGQFAKPRSHPTERRGLLELPAFRGYIVNSSGFDAAERRPDPARMIECYRAARSVLDSLRFLRISGSGLGCPTVWTSHETLLLDYELPLLRRDSDDRLILSSTHWPWVGERTRQLDAVHVRLLAGIANPVACKVGPAMSPGELVELCERLDPAREPGRLTLIARLGANLVEDRLPALVASVHAAGHPVIWLCDPMHGNTFRVGSGRKSRLVGSMIREVLAFHTAVRAEHGVAGGLHLEVTPDDVTECVLDEAELEWLPDRQPLCDPRLNVGQARLVAAAWPG